MIFNLTSSGYFYHTESKLKLEKLGFKFRPETFGSYEFYKIDNDLTININSLDDIINLSKEFGELVINENTIEIYDDYRE